jgi:hypothetical protein
MKSLFHRLASAEARHAVDPKTFKIPSRSEREDLWPGDLVKLFFVEIGARLWVSVVRLADDGTYRGRIVMETNDEQVREGDEVEFGPEHVADIARSRLHAIRSRTSKLKTRTLLLH